MSVHHAVPFCTLSSRQTTPLGRTTLPRIETAVIHSGLTVLTWMEMLGIETVVIHRGSAVLATDGDWPKMEAPAEKSAIEGNSKRHAGTQRLLVRGIPGSGQGASHTENEKLRELAQ